MLYTKDMPTTATTTLTTARKAMSAFLAKSTTAQLATAMMMLQEADRTSTHDRALAEATDEIARRFPEVQAALEAWEFDLDGTMNQTETAIAAIPMASL